MSDRVSMTVLEAVTASGLGRTSIYAAIQAGDLPTRKFGRRTLILRSDLEAFIASLPVRIGRAA